MLLHWFVAQKFGLPRVENASGESIQPVFHQGTFNCCGIHCRNASKPSGMPHQMYEFFRVSRPTQPMYELQSSYWPVTGHSAGELIEMVQYA